MSARCNLIIDSCCDLPPSVVNRPGVELVRFPFVCDGDERLDDLWQSTDMHAFYGRMRKGASPTTSHPVATELRGAFERSIEGGVPAVYLSFSSGLSSHFEYASTVLEEVLAKHSDADIRIVDTRLASTGEALLVYEALRRRDDGLTVDEMEKWANEARSRVSVYFMVDDLDALRRGGRIPRAVAFSRSREPFAVHFREKYGDCHSMPPYWMFVNVIDFGIMLTMYKGASVDIRNELAGIRCLPSTTDTRGLQLFADGTNLTLRWLALLLRLLGLDAERLRA